MCCIRQNNKTISCLRGNTLLYLPTRCVFFQGISASKIHGICIIVLMYFEVARPSHSNWSNGLVQLQFADVRFCSLFQARTLQLVVLDTMFQWLKSSETFQWLDTSSDKRPNTAIGHLIFDAGNDARSPSGILSLYSVPIAAFKGSCRGIQGILWKGFLVESSYSR